VTGKPHPDEFEILPRPALERKTSQPDKPATLLELARDLREFRFQNIEWELIAANTSRVELQHFRVLKCAADFRYIGIFQQKLPARITDHV
jgi:hypothetical protein